MVRQFGGEAERHLYRVLIGHLEWSGPQSGETHRPSPNNINNNNKVSFFYFIFFVMLRWCKVNRILSLGGDVFV